jgi:hypothetical protein
VNSSFAVTFFPNQKALSAQERYLTLTELGSEITAATAATKDKLRFLKLARFGSTRTAKKCLRNDANVKFVSGVEGDHDSSTMTVDQAVELLEKAGVEALIYTTASHTDEQPRWRVLAPFSEELPPEARFQMTARLNGILQGALADESFVTSQAFYFGGLGAAPIVRIIEGSRVDTCGELDRGSRGRSGPGRSNGYDRASPFDEFDLYDEPVDEDELVEAIVTGANYHRAALSLLGLWAREGLDRDVAEAQLRAIFVRVPASSRDDRWRNRFNDISRTADFVYGREEAKEKDEFEPDTGPDDTGKGFSAGAKSQPGFGSASVDYPWPAPIGEAAYHGLIGDYVRAIAPHTEADPGGILVQLVTAFGNWLSRDFFYPLGVARHAGNMNVVLVGQSSRSRKGSGLTELLGNLPDELKGWAKSCTTSGLSSGEGLIDRVRDRQVKQELDKETGDFTEVEVDPGVSDKRLLVVEEEFARVLRVMARPENILSTILRLAFDGRDLSTLTRKSSLLYSTTPHISLIGHITSEELQRELTDTEMANGFANRIAFHCVRRSKKLPFGGMVDPVLMEALSERLAAIARDIDEVRDRIAQGLSKPSTGAVKLAGAARPYWEREYDRLTEERYGLFGVLTARSEVYAVRRALVYAFFDRSPEIEEVHLRAAIELVRHSEDSVRHLFGGSLGDPVADRILEELISLAPNGLSRWGISKLFSGNRDRDRISAALAALARLGAVRSERQHGQRGRPVEVWFSC